MYVLRTVCKDPESWCRGLPPSQFLVLEEVSWMTLH